MRVFLISHQVCQKILIIICLSELQLSPSQISEFIIISLQSYKFNLDGSIINLMFFLEKLDFIIFNDENSNILFSLVNQQYIMIELSQQQKRKLKWEKINKSFFIIDSALSIICILLSFILIPDDCSMSFFLYYTIYFLGQSIQHFLIDKMPKIDVVKYELILRRYLTIVGIIQISYFFLTFMFWVKTQVHPFYCFLCLKVGMSALIGLVLTIHFIISLFCYIQFLYGYINRKYYLLALGGFQVEKRIEQQREINLQRLALIEPFYNQYPIVQEHQHVQNNKFYKFEDVMEDVESQKVCSICLTKNKVGFHPIFTTCKHYFHRQCIQNWAKINGKCPQCRAQFQQQKLQELKDLQVINQVQQADV